MGGCANSKYAVDEDKQIKKEKKPFLKKKSKKESVVSEAKQPVESVGQEEKPENDEKKSESGEPAASKGEKEDIDFIDREEAEKANQNTTETTTNNTQSDDAKKEVTTYQTTVVKHTQKEGDELLQYLKNEAFKTLQNSLTNLNQNRTQTTTASSSTNETPETATDDQNQDIVQQIKDQVLNSLGKNNEELINSVLDTGAKLIKDAKVKNMTELEQELEATFKDNAEMVKKVINSTTGFLTAKGTEAGVMLSNLLANANTGIQGIMNETEKTTVKVTRTVTEQVLSGGQLKEITRVITSDVPCSGETPCFQDLIKNISVDSKIVKTGTTVSNTNTTINQTQETLEESSVEKSNQQETTNVDSEKKDEHSEEISTQAEQVVNKVINAAVDIVNQQEVSTSNGLHEEHHTETETDVKIEEQSTVTTSTTKIILNGENTLDQIQSEFFKQGKQSAEEVVNKLNTNELVEISSN